MKKRILSIFLSICLLLTLFSTTALAGAASQIKVAGVELQSTGYYNMVPGSVGSKIEGVPAQTTGYVHWDKSTATLTLYTVTIDGGNEHSGIYANGDFTIVLVENTENTVTSGLSNAITCDRGSVTVKGAGALRATGATNGIRANYTVNIANNATVTVRGNNGCGIVNYPTVFSNNNDPVRFDATVTASITGSTYGISVEGGYGASPVINSPNVAITGGTAAFNVFPHGAPKLGEGIGALAGNSSQDQLSAYDSDSYSTYKYVKTWLPSYTVSFDRNGGFSGTMAAVTNVSGEYTLPENGFQPWSTQYFRAWDVNGVEKQPGDKINVTEDITVKAIWQDKDYGVTVGGVKITYENADNVTGTNIVGGTVSYDLATKTLLLDNVTVAAGKYMGGTVTSAIFASDSINVRLVGNNTVNGAPAAGETGSSHQYAIFSYNDITFTGTGSLAVTAADGGSFSAAISANNLTVNSGCTITAVSGTSDFSMRALDYDGDFTATGSTVLASTSATGTPLAAFGELGNGNSKYVKITPAYDVTVSFAANGGTGTMADRTVACAGEYTLPENGFTAPAGKQFKAWSVNGSEKAAGDKVYFVENTTVTAIWEDPDHVCSLQPVEKVPATCENGGKEAYYKCDICGKAYEDACGAKEITDLAAWGNLSKNGHTESAWKSDKNNHWKECTATDCGELLENSKAAHADANNDGKCDTCAYNVGAATSKPDNKPTEDPKHPDTGDHSNIALWIILLCLSATGLVALELYRRKIEK